MKYITLIVFIIFSYKAHSVTADYLNGNVPEDIYYEMSKRNCTVIKGFYSLERSEGGDRIGSPFDDGYAYQDGGKRKVTVFGCEALKSDSNFTYKLVITYSDNTETTRNYTCNSDETCPALPVKIYESFRPCSDEIFLHEKPAGIKIRAKNTNENIVMEFTNTVDSGAVGSLYSCKNGRWNEQFIH